MPGARLSLDEREEIALGLAIGRSFADIARGLERPTSTVSRELPERYGPWQTCYDRFRKWAADGTFERIFEHVRVVGQPEPWVMVYEDAMFVDGSVVRAHQHAAGARKDPEVAQAPEKGGPDRQIVRIWDGREVGLVPRFISRWMAEADPCVSA